MAVTAERQKLGTDAGTTGSGEYVTPVPATRSPYDRFYREFAPRVAGMVRRRVPDEDLVDDIVQETLLRAYRKGLHLEGGSEAWRWVATVARNLCIDARRRRHNWVETSLEQMPHAPVPTTQIDLGDLAAERTEVSEALHAIRPRERRLLVAHHLNGEACRDLAEREGLSQDAVKSALARARTAFRDAYASVVDHAVPAVIALGAPVVRRVRAARNRLYARSTPPLGAETAATASATVQGLAGVAILGAVAVVGPLFDSGTPGTASLPEPSEVSALVAPAVEAPSGATLEQVGEPERRPEPDAQPAQVAAAPPSSTPAPPADEGGGHSVADGSVDTNDVVPVDEPPVSGKVGGKVDNGDDGEVVDVEVDHVVDADLGVEEVENVDEGSAGASVSCPPPEERGAATAAVCPVAEDAGMA